MEITPLDVADHDAIRSWHGTALAAHRHDRPDAGFPTEEEVVVMLTHDDPEEKVLAFSAVDAGTVLGSGVVWVPLLDNRDKAYAELSVLPEHRRRGVGSLMVEHVVAAARSEDRRTLVVEGWFPPEADDRHPTRAFALARGFGLANTEVRRVLRLPVPEDRIRAWEAAAAPHHAGYEIHTYLDHVPDALKPSLVELHNQLAVDAPTGDIDYEAGATTVGIFDEQTALRLRSGRRILVTVAVRDGEVVAHSTLSAPPPGAAPPHLSQWGTFVHRGHRGHRLGLAVKAVNLRAAQARFPGHSLIDTTNSPVNGPMLAINELMGFEPVEVLGEFLRAV